MILMTPKIMFMKESTEGVKEETDETLESDWEAEKRKYYENQK